MSFGSLAPDVGNIQQELKANIKESSFFDNNLSAVETHEIISMYVIGSYARTIKSTFFLFNQLKGPLHEKLEALLEDVFILETLKEQQVQQHVQYNEYIGNINCMRQTDLSIIRRGSVNSKRWESSYKIPKIKRSGVFEDIRVFLLKYNSLDMEAKIMFVESIQSDWDFETIYDNGITEVVQCFNKLQNSIFYLDHALYLFRINTHFKDHRDKLTEYFGILRVILLVL